MIIGISLAALAATAGEPAIHGGIMDAPPEQQVLFETSFEEGQPELELDAHAIATDYARTGERSATARVTEPEQWRKLIVPFDAKKDHKVELSFWTRAEPNSRGWVWGNGSGGQRDHMTNINPIRRAWSHVTAPFLPAADGPAFIEISVPSSHSGTWPAQAWLDDIKLVELLPPQYLTPHVEDFPALAVDGRGTVWLSVVAWPGGVPQIRLYRVSPQDRELVHVFESEHVTGFGAPVLAPLKEGCAIAFAAETARGWQICCGRVTSGEPVSADVSLVTRTGNNINPAIAVAGKRICAVWEASAPNERAIYASWEEHGLWDVPMRLSAGGVNSYNPDIAALKNGSLFAAWDSVREESADLYGAWYRDGGWQPELRLTSHPRIERHVSLAARKNEVWLAWQAQSFRDHLVNGVDEQRIVVARLDGENLLAPKSLFQDVSPTGVMLLRPTITFDDKGRLWLTARKSMGKSSGWQPLAWCYSGDAWSGPHAQWPEQGRWRPARLAWGRDGGIIAFQRDNLPMTHTQYGDVPAWKSDVLVMALQAGGVPKAKKLATEPLNMPETDFRLATRSDKSSAHLPHATQMHGGGKFHLYWGDLHEHTDVSVCARAINPPAHDLFANQRDIERLDFTALTDHGYNLDPAIWAYEGEQTRANHDDRRFVTFLAQEWTSANFPYDPPKDITRYGHRNLIHLDPYYARHFDAYDNEITPRMLWDQLGDAEFVMIPHQLADYGGHKTPTDWSFTDERLQPLAEIYQQRASYEYLGCPQQSPSAMDRKGHFLQDAWAQGIVIGVIASPDHGGGRGKAGVWAEELTRESLFEAFRARHTFGTSGAKIALHVASGDAMLGDKVQRAVSGPIPLSIRVATTKPIAKVVILRNNEPVKTFAVNASEAELAWEDTAPPDVERLWYYVRVERADNELAWSSPIWFER